MPILVVRAFLVLACLLSCGLAATLAAPTNPRDADINAIRGSATISDLDQGKVAEWIREELKICIATAGQGKTHEAWQQFIERFEAQRKNPANSPQFITVMYVQLANISKEALAKKDYPVSAAIALASVLSNSARIEAYPGLLVGLVFPNDIVRTKSAIGLSELKTQIATDAQKLTETIQALQDAGVNEKSPIVVGRIYEALAFPNQLAKVLGAYLAIFDARLALRRGGWLKADLAEVHVFDLLIRDAGLKALTQEQKAQLVSRVAVFLRFAGQRYNTPGLEFHEKDALERLLAFAEELLIALGATGGGTISSTLASGGAPAAILTEVYKWIGDAASNTTGALNAAPWNVPVGAP